MRRSVSILGLAGWMAVTAEMLVKTGPDLAAAAQQAPTMEVKIDNFSFGPSTITVGAGTTVTWVNRDDIPHTVVSDNKIFKSKALDTDDKFSYTFKQAGTYSYFCSLHPKMTGKVIVQ
jgi:plastocyanin